jgi:hypothetical protein
MPHFQNDVHPAVFAQLYVYVAANRAVLWLCEQMTLIYGLVWDDSLKIFVDMLQNILRYQLTFLLKDT